MIPKIDGKSEQSIVYLYCSRLAAITDNLKFVGTVSPVRLTEIAFVGRNLVNLNFRRLSINSLPSNVNVSSHVES